MPCGCLERLRVTNNGACFGTGEHGRDRTHRYSLWRVWNHDLTMLLAIMLNPSTADETVLDNTLKKVQKFAMAWGHGGFVIGNAFALRATLPTNLLADPRAAVGPENDAHLIELQRHDVGRVIVGWGTNLDRKPLRFRMAEMRKLIRPDVVCWNVSASGQPMHPLYQLDTEIPKEYRWLN